MKRNRRFVVRAAKIGAIAGFALVAGLLQDRGAASAGGTGEIEFLPPDSFASVASDPEVVLISLDEEVDFQKHRIPGSECWAAGPTPRVLERMAEGARLAVYSSCCIDRTASRILDLRRLFTEAPIVVLSGGLPAWQAAGHPIEGSRPEAARDRAAYRSLDEMVALESFLVNAAIEKRELEEARAAASTPEEIGRIDGALNDLAARSDQQGRALKADLKRGRP